MQNSNGDREWMTPQEVADELKINYITVIRWINSNELKAYRVGVQWRVNREDFDSWMSSKVNCNSPRPGPSAETAYA